MIALHLINHLLDGTEHTLVERVGKGAEHLVATHITLVTAGPRLEIEVLLLQRCHLLLQYLSLKEEVLGQFRNPQVAAAGPVVE